MLSDAQDRYISDFLAMTPPEFRRAEMFVDELQIVCKGKLSRTGYKRVG